MTNQHEDEIPLSADDIAAMNLGTTSTARAPLAPDEPAADPTLDERLIIPRGQSAQAPQEQAEQLAQEDTAAEAPPEAPAESAPRYFLVKHQNIKLGSIPHTRPTRLKDEEATLVTTLPLPSTTAEGIEACIEDGNPRTVDEKWLDVLDRSQKVLFASTEHQDALSRPDSEWHNRLVGENNQPLTIQRLRAAFEGDAELRAERAALAIRSHIGLGTIVNIPLWNSGMWITIRDPGDAAIQEAVRKQTTERMRVGRSTHAMGFSNFMVFTIETMTELVLSSMTARTTHSDVDLLKNISILDFGTLVWGMAAAVFPNGFEYNRPCTSGAEKCNHVLREVLNISTCLFADEKKLTKDQIKHMTNLKKGWAKEEDLQRYRDQFTSNLGYQKPIKASNGSELLLTMQIPTIGDCIEAGHDWIGMISNFVTQALGLDANNEQRQAYQQDIAMVTAAGQFTQWVKEITVGESVIRDRATLRSVFYNDISPDDKLLENMKNTVQEFSTNSMVSVVGILNYTCPSCNKPQMVAEGDDPKDPKQALPLVVAIDPVSTFLELMYRKFLAIRQRT